MKNLLFLPLFFIYTPIIVNGQSPSLIKAIELNSAERLKFRKNIQSKSNTLHAIIHDNNATVDDINNAMRDLEFRLTTQNTEIIKVYNSQHKTVTLLKMIEDMKLHNEEIYYIKILGTHVTDGELEKIYYIIEKR